MVVAVWSVKGGSGASSVAAMLAVGQVEHAYDALLVDMCGDMAAVLGVDEDTDQPGVTDWCAAPASDPEALRRLEVQARTGLQLLPHGTTSLVSDPQPLLRALADNGRDVIIDCGLVVDDRGFRHRVVQAATTSLVVVRPCYLNLRMLQRSSLTPTGVVVITEKRRVLGRADIEVAANAPVVAEIACDSTIARCIDAGLVSARLPRSLVRAMGKVLSNVA